MNVVFARPRHDYGSYRDVWDIITLSGYPIQYVDQINWQDPKLVVIGIPKHPDWANIPEKKNAKLIWYNIERMHTDEPAFDMSNPFVPPQVDEVWAADSAIAVQQHAKYVFFGGHQAFPSYAARREDGTLGAFSFSVRPKKWEVITLMAPLPNRAAFMADLRANFALADTGSLWGSDRLERLMQTCVMVMTHQDSARYVWPPRMMVGACHAMPMLCETVYDPGWWYDYGACQFAPLQNMIERIKCLLGDKVKRARLGAAAWRLACVERTFKGEIERALAE
jgi:hypothetical protein